MFKPCEPRSHVIGIGADRAAAKPLTGGQFSPATSGVVPVRCAAWRAAKLRGRSGAKAFRSHHPQPIPARKISQTRVLYSARSRTSRRSRPPAAAAWLARSESHTLAASQVHYQVRLLKIGRDISCYRSSGFRPVRFAIRANMCGPISSSSWKAKTKSGQPPRANVRCEPAWRLIRHPIRRRAVRTRRAFAEGQLLKRPGTRRSRIRPELPDVRGVRR